MTSTELTFRSGDHELTGTLTLPDGGARGAVLLIGGSGRLDRDGNHWGLRLSIQAELAEGLTGAGWATFRYDRRGVGASQGEWLATGFRDNIDDACAAVTALAAASETPTERIVVAGHSEGALIAAAAAAARARAGLTPLGGAILLSGSARRGDDLTLWQARQVEPTLPRPVRLLVRLRRGDLLTQVRRNHEKLRAITKPVARVGGPRVNALWHREFLDHDPRDDLAVITTPVLAITGSKDLQVPPSDLEVIAKTCRGPVVTHLMSDLSHILRTQPGAPSIRSYRADARRPVDPRVLEAMVTWLAEVVPPAGSSVPLEETR